MKIVSVEKTEVFYVTTEEGVEYRRVPGLKMDDDTWYITIGEGEFIVKNREVRNTLKEAYLDYAERAFSGVC